MFNKASSSAPYLNIEAQNSQNGSTVSSIYDLIWTRVFVSTLPCASRLDFIAEQNLLFSSLCTFAFFDLWNSFENSFHLHPIAAFDSFELITKFCRTCAFCSLRFPFPRPSSSENLQSVPWALLFWRLARRFWVLIILQASRFQMVRVSVELPSQLPHLKCRMGLMRSLYKLFLNPLR